MLQRLILTVATIAAFSVSFGARDVSAAGYGAGGAFKGSAGQFGGNAHSGAWQGSSAWHGGQSFSGWHGGSAWQGGSAWHAGKNFNGGQGGNAWRGGRKWRGAVAGWGFYDPFIGYPYLGFPYAESLQYLQCLRRVRNETLYGVSWRSVWVCN
jgi:hypothetical protein